MDNEEVIDHLKNRPAMFGLDSTFRDAVIFLSGMDAAKGGAVLYGFREWLVVEAGFGNNLSWGAIVMRISLPQGPVLARGSHNLSASEEKTARAALFENLERFFTARSAQNGILQIYDSYLKWLKRREWYTSDSPYYLD